MRALALQGCAAADTTVAGASQASTTTAVAVQSSAHSQSPIMPGSLVGELSFAAFTGQQQQKEVSDCTAEQTANATRTLPGQPAASMPTHDTTSEADADVDGGDQHHAQPLIPVSSEAFGLFGAAGQQGLGVCSDMGDDQVLFDDELASYISDTDYTQLMAEDSNHLLKELQAVLADKMALEDEKAAALVRSIHSLIG